jgi:hypothetical protein
MKAEPVLREFFYHDGRGPELQKVHYRQSGKVIAAIDYFNPDDVYSPDNLKHLVFIRPQVFMFTPEEVYNGLSSPVFWAELKHAAMVATHESDWLLSFNQRHLGKCQHYQVMFYDEFLDVICEGIEAKSGGYLKQD